MPICSCGNRLDAPSRYSEPEDSVEHICTACPRLESVTHVPLNEIPDDGLKYIYIYRRCGKIDKSLEIDNNEPRFSRLLEEVKNEMKSRNIQIPDILFTHIARMNKSQALDIQDEIPSIITIGEPFDIPECEDTFIDPEKYGWKVTVTSEERDRLENEYDEVEFEELS